MTGEWDPPSPGADAVLVQAGVWWDAVRVPTYLASRALARLGDACGAVIADPYAHRLYWLVPVGAAAGWTFPATACVQVLSSGCRIIVPPEDRVRSLGPHWMQPLDDGRLLTPADALHQALLAVVTAELGPRARQEAQ